MSPITMKTLSALSLATLVAAGTWTAPAQAFNFGNMWNPNRWMGGGNRYNDYYYDDGPWGGNPWGGGYGAPWGGYGGGPWGAPYGAPGYGAPGYGYGAPGYPLAPAATAPTGAPAPLPSQGTAPDADEVSALKRRIRELEAAQQPSGRSVPAQDWPAAPVYRPMDKQ